MINNLRKIVNLLSVAAVGGFLLYSCEPESDKLGEQFFVDGEAQANTKGFDLIAYNINNNDSVRSDATRLDSATIGVFNDPVFGKQNASFATQVKLSNYDPDFGTNPIVDSVVMVVKPYYNASNVTTITNESYVYPDGNVDAKVEIKKYPVKKFGNTATSSMNVKVEEVTTFLDSPSDKQYSNKTLTLGSVLGQTTFDGNVKSVNITKDSDASSLYSSNAGIRILLDKNFFQTKIIAMKGKPELQNAANFIRYLKGLKISMTDNDGYLMTISSNTIDLKMYYNYDKTDNGVTTKVHNVYPFVLGAGNTHIGLGQFDRSGLPANGYNTYVTNTPNVTTGDPKIYLQAMGGPSMGVKISPTDLTSMKNDFVNNKIAIINAKIRVYTDNPSGISNLPKPDAFNIISRVFDPSENKFKNSFTADLLSYGSLPTFQLYKSYNLDQSQAYYDFSVTKSLKDFVEGVNTTDIANQQFIIGIGNFLSSAGANGGAVLIGNDMTTRATAYKRTVLIGSENGNDKRIKLLVTYGTK